MLMRALLRQRTVEFAEIASFLDATSAETLPREDAVHQQAMVISVRQTHLPKLEAAELASVDRDDDVVELCLHPDIYEGPLTPHLLGAVDQDVWKAVATVYRDRRRGEVLTLLDRATSPQTVSTLASTLADTSEQTDEYAPERGTETKQEIKLELHHAHLPLLANVGLVAYDTDSGAVTYTGDKWFELSAFVDTLPPRMHANT
ncbi:hypothetical protein C453_03369 [Haloferax elongans ATCC BAA-1513]|uniref:DUF7344 domain-containing protein n=2 Tax=Haloferax elongans TaxID=403191 RepID=M0HUD2_HALEO|nr:hypothetical protein C453_03369 [Haloferax elongans ATCC BAA-1513]